VSESADLQSVANDMYRNAPQPDAIARLAFDGIRANQLYVFPSDRFDEPIRARMEAILSRTNPTFESLLSLSKGDAGLRDTAA